MRPKSSPLATAVRLLAARSMSRQELTDALLRRQYTADEVQDTVEACVEHGYVNESHYAALLVQKYAEQGYGIPAVAAKLRAKGFSTAIIAEALTEFTVSETALDKLAVKALKGDDSPTSQKRACQSLMRRGFSYSDARAALERVIQEQNRFLEDEYAPSWEEDTSLADSDWNEDTMGTSEDTDVPNGAEYV